MSSPSPIRGRVPALVAAIVLAAAAPGEPGGTRAAMHEILSSLRTLIEATAEPDAFRARRDDPAVHAAARELADQAAMVAEHAGADDPGTDFLASALERYALLVRHGLEWRDFDRTRVLVRRAAGVCIACHTRRASGDAGFGKRLVDEELLGGLPDPERARLLIATRRFTAALETLESLALSERADDDARRAALRLYVVVSVRVRRDPASAADLLDRVLAGARSPLARDDAERWLEDLHRYARHAPRWDDLGEARGLVERAAGAPARGFVDYVVASAILETAIDTGIDDPAARAEAFYFRGLAELGLSSADDWLPQPELYLESAILARPDGPYARPAYRVLAEVVREAYADEDGVVPEEIERHLEWLRVQADVAHTPE